MVGKKEVKKALWVSGQGMCLAWFGWSCIHKCM